jgi:hypothetical protein
MNAKLHSTLLFAIVCIVSLPVSQSIAQPTVGAGWAAINLEFYYGNLFGQCTNRNYGGYNHLLAWPGGWWNSSAHPTERRVFANYRGFVIGARNVADPQYPGTVWPYMVGQRDGRNDGEQGEAHPSTAPDVLTPNRNIQFLFKGRLARRTFRQAHATVRVDGEVNPFLWHRSTTNQTVEWVGDEDDAVYQNDTFDPTIPADLTFETYSWTRMGVSNSRMIYQFADRRNDDYMFWHWRLINDGRWGRLGIDTHECCGGTIDTVQGVMLNFMVQWGRNSAGAHRTASAGEANNDSIWRYYGVDYDAASPTEDMRLVYVIDGNQSQTKYNPAHGKQNDIGDPDPITGHLLSAKTGGWQILHYDRSPIDQRDDTAQPRTVGWENYSRLVQTSVEGHEAKYNQMLWGAQRDGRYNLGPYQETPDRDPHPEAATGASWIKASNDPATSGQYWPGKVLGVDIDVTDIEQQVAFGPDDIAPFDTLNGIYVYAVKGLEEPHAMEVGRQWLAGEITDAEKDSLVHSTIDSLFMTMRQAKSVYESAQFDDGQIVHSASSRAEFEETLWAAIDQGKLALSPPAPATFDVNSGPGRNELSWTLNTTTGSDIAGWRLYRAVGGPTPDYVWTMIAGLAPETLAYTDSDVEPGYSYFYYLTTYDTDGNESTMHTRTSDPAVPAVSVRSNMPSRFVLSQNAPNPFNPTTTIPFIIPDAGNVSLTIHSVTGQHVRTLIDAHMGTGQHAVTWDGTDDAGRAVASGVYLYRISAGKQTHVRRLVVVR